MSRFTGRAGCGERDGETVGAQRRDPSGRARRPTITRRSARSPRVATRTSRPRRHRYHGGRPARRATSAALRRSLSPRSAWRPGSSHPGVRRRTTPPRLQRRRGSRRVGRTPAPAARRVGRVSSRPRSRRASWLRGHGPGLHDHVLRLGPVLARRQQGVNGKYLWMTTLLAGRGAPTRRTDRSRCGSRAAVREGSGERGERRVPRPMSSPTTSRLVLAPFRHLTPCPAALAGQRTGPPSGCPDNDTRPLAGFPPRGAPGAACGATDAARRRHAEVRRRDPHGRADRRQSRRRGRGRFRHPHEVSRKGAVVARTRKVTGALFGCMAILVGIGVWGPTALAAGPRIAPAIPPGAYSGTVKMSGVNNCVTTRCLLTLTGTWSVTVDAGRPTAWLRDAGRHDPLPAGERLHDSPRSWTLTFNAVLGRCNPAARETSAAPGFVHGSDGVAVLEQLVQQMDGVEGSPSDHTRTCGSLAALVAH